MHKTQPGTPATNTFSTEATVHLRRHSFASLGQIYGAPVVTLITAINDVPLANV